MKKKDIIKSQKEFNLLIKSGKFIKNDDYVIYYKENDLSKKRFGIAVSTKLGNAVIRNRLKRQTKEIVDKLNYLFKNDKDYIITIWRGCITNTFHERINKLEKLLKERI